MWEMLSKCWLELIRMEGCAVVFSILGKYLEHRTHYFTYGRMKKLLGRINLPPTHPQFNVYFLEVFFLSLNRCSVCQIFMG